MAAVQVVGNLNVKVLIQHEVLDIAEILQREEKAGFLQSSLSGRVATMKYVITTFNQISRVLKIDNSAKFLYPIEKIVTLLDNSLE